ncbi:transcription initiation factor TFIID subunit 9-like [Rutidosis leptorrhynchoides]|uniref:transcription initiation factor TFIID subunit 9-like n=1 Tax=Rutidosis leptorrhynchoides TaxID=125765 RepID=UPI003A9A021B
MADGDENIPRDVKTIKALLASMGVNDYEPRVVHQFLELLYRFGVDMLTDAKTYSNHAGKATMDHHDVELAIKIKSNLSSVHLSQYEVKAAALKVNKREFPELLTLRSLLPPNQDTLVSTELQREIEQSHSIRNVVDLENESEKDEIEVVQMVLKPQDEQRNNLLPKTHQRVSFSLGSCSGRRR